jgi:hypothetical protein
MDSHNQASSDFQIRRTRIDMRSPEGDAFSNGGDDIAIVRFAFLEGKLKADFIVRRAALQERYQQRLGLR